MSALAVVVIVSVLAVLAVILLAIYLMDRDDRSDPFAGAGLTIDAAQAMDIDMTMPVEIAHDRNPFLPRMHDELNGPAFLPLKTPPATMAAPLPAPGNPDGAARLGAAAAAAPYDATPPASPPPLPTPWLAANHPDQVPFREWEKDDFVLAVNDLKDGA